jgi:Putative peptidoglycan binding domain
VRERRNDDRRRAAAATSAAAVAGFVAAVAWRIWTKAARRPVDSLAIFGAAALSFIIIVNAAFLQSGVHPAPFFAVPAQSARPGLSGLATLNPAAIKPVESSAARLPAGARAPQSISARRNDPIAQLISSFIGSPSQVIAVQRALSEFGYGQVRPSGVIDEATSAAIVKFEREHQLPVTGRLSDRLVNELSAITGRPLD